MARECVEGAAVGAADDDGDLGRSAGGVWGTDVWRSERRRRSQTTRAGSWHGGLRYRKNSPKGATLKKRDDPRLRFLCKFHTVAKDQRSL